MIIKGITGLKMLKAKLMVIILNLISSKTLILKECFLRIFFLLINDLLLLIIIIAVEAMENDQLVTILLSFSHFHERE